MLILHFPYFIGYSIACSNFAKTLFMVLGTPIYGKETMFFISIKKNFMQTKIRSQSILSDFKLFNA